MTWKPPVLSHKIFPHVAMKSGHGPFLYANKLMNGVQQLPVATHRSAVSLSYAMGLISHYGQQGQNKKEEVIKTKS